MPSANTSKEQLIRLVVGAAGVGHAAETIHHGAGPLIAQTVFEKAISDVSPADIRDILTHIAEKRREEAM